MELHIKPTLHFCFVEGRTIFLDEETNRYFCIPLDLDRPFQRIAEARERTADGIPDDAVRALVGLDILEPRLPGARTIADRCPLVHPNADLGTPPPQSICVPTTAAALLQRLRADWIVARCAIADIRRLIEQERGRFAPRKAARTHASDLKIARAMDVSDYVLGRKDRCLPRSIAIIRCCLRTGHEAALVIGVRINPFAAHCWAQRGSTVLGDSLEIARIYTPICAF
ncbi:lasso peptide biosynthesis B2 protein [Novosphingobium profundi]|uniref:lasso peptide biosynthesis B2 protein n=1 Tax=Novosphingobium profundi TaxID=1774954 RepID=UPI001BD91651|nr:lasso peptide biosynthesis B2 protein [Novosphingobium profundi]MBT0667400.1 lasso peptide biosynthesis B2 protein [Novosphingobium profundi]